MISVHGEGMAVAKHIGGGGVEMKTSTHSSLLTREFVGNHHRFGSGGATGVARDSYFRSSEKYSVSIMWVCQRQSKMLVITWAHWQARNVARGQPLRRRSGGHGRCSVERCFLKFHRSRGVSSIGGFVCHPVEWQLGSLSTARTRTRVDGHNGHNGREATGGGAGRGGSVKRQCCVRHGGLRCPELQYRIGFHHDGFRPAG